MLNITCPHCHKTIELESKEVLNDKLQSLVDKIIKMDVLDKEIEPLILEAQDIIKRQDYLYGKHTTTKLSP